MPPRETSWPEWAYPAWRDSSSLTSEKWLVKKKADDGAEGLWRIHDNLYDLSSWINKHPGGSDWISMTNVLLHNNVLILLSFKQNSIC